MAALALLDADPRTAARLSAALAGEHRMIVCGSWDALRTALDEGDFDGCIVDADHPDRTSALARIAGLRERYPRLAIIACIDAGFDVGVYDLGGLGLAGMIVGRPHQPPAKVRAEVDQALSAGRAERVFRSLEGRYAPPGPEAIAWAIEHAGPDASVEALAAGVGLTPRALRQGLADAGLPSPARVLLWGRLLMAGARLGHDRRTVENVAFSLGYATATSLTRAMKSQTGLTPGALSCAGGMERVRDALFPAAAEAALRIGKIAGLAALFALTGCAGLGLGGGRVDRRAIDDVLASPPLVQAHVGILAADAHSGAVLYARDASRWFVPASNQKLLIAAAAWSLLGPEYRWRTELRASGPVTDGRLDGDLVLIGSGDPTLSRRFHDSGVAALDALADSIRSAGIREITGRLVVDVSAWDSTTVGPTREVDDLVFAYGATGGAFAIDEGEVSAVVRGGARTGDPVEVEASPRGGDGRLTWRLDTSARDSATRVTARYLPESRRLVLEGQVAAGAVDTVAFAQRDPVRWASAEMAAALARAGVRVAGGWEVRWSGTTPAEDHPLVAHESPPLVEVMAEMLGPSQNWIAEQVVRTLGAEAGDGGSLSDGLAVTRTFLIDEVGIDPADFRARDVAGLSAYNLVTPRALVRILMYMDARPDAPVFRRALAEPGEPGSTLEDRLAGLEGRIFAKTGTISNVNSLSGFLVGGRSGDVVFSILSNAAGASASEVRTAIDRIARILAR